MIKQCKKCQADYNITEKDQEFYKKVSPTFNGQVFEIPEPILCPDCRQQRRQSFRNEFNLYHRKCDLCKNDFISNYSSDKSYKVYCPACYFGDGWDPLEYGRDFNFSRPFFQQFKELYDDVPKLGLIALGDNENSDYTHDAYRLKNCYLTFDGEQAKDCYYGETFVGLKDCCDFLTLQMCELCYECVNCKDCYNLKYSQFCFNCSDSAFLVDCIGCKNCFGCANLHRKDYYIFNEPHTKEKYEEKMKFLELHNYDNVQKAKEIFQKFNIEQFKKEFRGHMNENVSGDNVHNSKGSDFCFDCDSVRDCKFCTNVQLSSNDCYDIDIWGDRMSLCYNGECVGAGAERIIGSFYCGFDSNNLYHSIFCWKGSHDIFGSVGLTKKSYCIFNKQYSKEEYEKLAGQIAEHMIKTNEFGQFFPIQLSSFGYNETVAQLFYPINKFEAKERKYQWQDKDVKEYKSQTYKIPSEIEDVTDEIIGQTLVCEECGKNYKVVEQELLYYKRMQTPVPHKCFNCRHIDRYKLRNPRKLWDRKCDKCSAEIKTTYSPERPEKVYCEKCYLKEIN